MTANQPPHRPHGGLPRPGQSTTATPSFDALSILQRLTSYMALKDPELLATTASVVDPDSLSALFRVIMVEQSATPIPCSYIPNPRQHHGTRTTTSQR